MRLPIVHPYRKLKNYILAGNEVSARKKACMCYLRWCYKGDRADKEALVESLIAWRKIERRVGGHRTLMERKGRRYFKEVRLRKARKPCREGAKRWGENAVKEGVGAFAPEHKPKLKEYSLRGTEVRREQNKRHPTAKDWIVYSPTGEVFRLTGLIKLCKEHGLDKRTLYGTRRKPGKTHKGWRVELDEHDPDRQ